MKKYKLPMISRFFLSFFLNHSHPDEMLGDFDEIYYDITKEKGNIIARLWYWFQIILAIPSFFKNAFYWSGIMFKNYLKIAYRNILRHKTYSFINIAGLATGMTISILILAWIQNELSYDTFHENSERIYRITQKHNNPESGYTPHFARCSFDWIKELQGEIPEINSIVRFGHHRRTIKARDNKFNVNNFFIADSNVFDVFSFKLIHGDPKTALKNANNVVINREIAEKCFGYNDPIGKTIETFSRGDHQGKLFTITGVMENIPKNSHFHPEILASIKSDEREGGWYYTYLFMEPHCITEELEKKIMPLIERNLGEKAASIISFPLQKLTDIHLHSNINRELESNGNIIYIYMFSAIAILILLIASINFMNLSTARWTKRAKEVSIRKVLGSKRSQLISYFLGESILFSITGFIIAIIFSIIFLPVFNELTGKVISLSLKNNRVIYLVLSLIVFITGLVSGSYPAIYLSSFNPVTVLKSGTGTMLNSTSDFKITLRKVLVVLQFTISIILIISTMTIYSQLKYIQNKNLGLNKEQTIAIKNIPSLIQNKYMTYKNEVLKIPGITGVSASMDEPSKQILDGGNFEAEGIQQDEENRKIIYALPVDGNIIDFFSMEMVAGEKFTPGPWNDSIDTYILNQTAVNTIGWKNPQEAIGKTFRLQLGVPEAYQPKKGKIIGVVKDFNFSTLHKKVKPMVLFQKSYWVFCILVKVQPDKIQENISTLEKKWSEMFPQYAFEYSFVDDLFADIYLSEQKQGKIVGIFSSLAVFIACLGLFGLAAFTTEQRTKEIGIRKVMGASVSGIVLLLSKEFTKWIFIANIIAWPIAWFLMDSWLENFAYKIELELWMFIFTGCLALFIALITVIFQAVKAAIANPVKALKYE